MSICGRLQKGRDCVKQPAGVIVKSKKLCTGCDKPGKNQKRWRNVALPEIRAKLAKIKESRLENTCIMTGCYNKTKGNEPVCAECLRKSKPSPNPKVCKHPRKFGVPSFAQRLLKPVEVEGGINCRGVGCVMQLYTCPDCLTRWWEPLPILLENGSIYPDERSLQIEREYRSFLFYGKEGGLRRETYEKLKKKIWDKQATKGKTKC